MNINIFVVKETKEHFVQWLRAPNITLLSFIAILNVSNEFKLINLTLGIYRIFNTWLWNLFDHSIFPILCVP